MRRFFYTPVDQALKRILQLNIKPSGSEIVPIQEAYERILATDIEASHNVPYSDCSHFDGYAIRSKDTVNASPKNPIYLTVMGSIYPGEIAGDKINIGEAYYVATGAFLPKGSDTVIAIENVKMISENIIEVKRRIRVGEHVIHAGRDVKKGESILQKGHVLKARHIAFLVYLNIKKVSVNRRPIVALISTGDEFTDNIESGESCMFVNSHHIILSNLIKEVGGLPIDLGVVPDDLEKIGVKIKQSLRTADLIVTIGGTSMGKKDFVPESIKLIGGKIIVHGIKRKPGRVSGLSIVGNKPVVMLPGLIQSTIVGFHTLAVPLIRRMLGATTMDPGYTIKAKITHQISFKTFLPFQQVIFVKIERKQNEFTAEPVIGESILFSSMVKADGFTIIHENERIIKKGDKVEVHVFSGFSLK